MTQHVHAALIKKWADGALVQFFNTNTNKWQDAPSPMWSPSTQYRLKPKLHRYRVCLYNDCNGTSDRAYAVTGAHYDGFETSTGFIKWLSDWIEFEMPENTK